MTTLAPLSWIKQVQEGSSLCQKIPLWGSSCPILPLEKISEEIQNTLGVTDLHLLISQCQLLEPDNFLTLLGTNPQILSFQLSPLPGYLTWAISAETMRDITYLFLSQTETKGLSDIRLQEGFYQFLLLQISSIIENLHTYPDLHIQWLDTKELPKNPCLGVDLSIKIKESSFLGRLIISSEFHTAFADHFSKNPFSYITSPSYTKIEVPLSLEIGSCLLKKDELTSLHAGDFLILDHCSYDPITDKGTAILTLAEKPCFIVKIKKNALKILDYAVYTGDSNTMDEKVILDSFEEEPIPPNFEEIEKDIEEETPLPSSEEMIKETEEDDSFIEDATPSQTLPPESLTPPLQISFPVVVEVAQITMSLEKLLQLTPGNILDLTVKPNQGVYLTVHGKKIAKGELIKVGEVLGVKIIETANISSS